MSDLLNDASLVLIPSGIKASKIYSQIPEDGSGDLTFSRASGATRVNSLGLIESVSSNIPRLNYQNGGSGCPSLLLEPQRSNLFTYSEDFSDASYTKRNSSIVSNNTISPDGYQNADKLVEDSSNNRHDIYKEFTATSGTTYTQSIFVKKGARDYFFMSFGSSSISALNTFFDLVNGSVVSTPSGVVSTITTVGNSWYRCTITATAVSTGLAYLVAGSSTNGTSISYQGNGTDGVYLWGAQLEAGSYPTSYIPTLSTAVTRVADAANKTSVSALIGQSEGTIFAEVYYPNIANGGESAYIYVTDGSFSNAVVMGREPTTPPKYLFYIGGGGSNVLYNANISLQNNYVKMAIAYKSRDWAAYINGSLIQSGTTTFSMSGLSRFSIGSNDAGQTMFVDSTLCKQAVLFPTRLTNAQLADLTTL